MRRLTWLALALLLGLFLVPLARAQDGGVEELRQELDRLRVIYTDQHPDVQRARRALERAEQARRAKRQAGGEQERQAPDQAR